MYRSDLKGTSTQQADECLHVSTELFASASPRERAIERERERESLLELVAGAQQAFLQRVNFEFVFSLSFETK